MIKQKTRRLFIVLSLIIMLGLILRLYNLGGTSLWNDELRTATRIDGSLVQTMERCYYAYNPPLYYLLMNFWMRIFGESESALRFPSLIFSVLSIIFIYKLSSELFNKEVGIISALLLSISPYSINYAQDAKMYSMLWFFGLLSFLFFYRFTKDDKRETLTAYVVFTTIAVYTKYIAFLFVIAQNILYFVFFKRRPFKKWLVGQLIIILLYSPWMDKFLLHAVYKKGILWVPKVTSHLRHLASTFLLTTGISIGRRNLIWWVIEASIYLLLIISAFIYLKNIKSGKKIFNITKSDYLILAWIIIAISIYWLMDVLIRPLFNARYMGFIHIPLIILISKGLAKYNVKLKSIILSFLIVITFSNHLYPYFRHHLKIDQHQDWKALFKNIYERIDNDYLVTGYVPDFAVNYYNRNHEINILPLNKEVEKNIVDRTYDSIFFVWGGNEIAKKEIVENFEQEGYVIEEVYLDRLLGYLRFKKKVEWSLLGLKTEAPSRAEKQQSVHPPGSPASQAGSGISARD